MIDIGHLFQKFTETRVLVIGDSIVDCYWWGFTERISPEAPVPVVQVKSQENRIGGAGNVALNLKKLGARVTLISSVGADSHGHEFLKMLESDGLRSDKLLICADRQTTVKNRIICDGKIVARFDQELTALIDKELEARVLNSIGEVLHSGIDLVVFVDYDKGLITPGVIEQVIQWTKQLDVVTVADPKIKNFRNYQNVDLLKPNLNEFNSGTSQNLEFSDIPAIKAASRQFMAENQIEKLFLTLSEKGVLITETENQYYFDAAKKTIVDVSGAGDTVISVAGLCLASGVHSADLAYIANLAGGLACQKLGVAPVTAAELIAELKNASNFEFRQSEEKDINSVEYK